LRYIISALLLAALLQIFYWLGSNDTVVSPPDAKDSIQSLSYAPYNGASSKEFLSDEEIFRDLSLLKHFTNQIRVYSAEDAQRVFPSARQLGMKVHFGFWLSGNAEANTKEIQLAKKLIDEYYTNIQSIIVGNEVLLRDDLTLDQLIEVIRDIKKMVYDIDKRYPYRKYQPPVTTAEVWNLWIDNPSLGKEVDYINIHVLPYWETIKAEQFMQFFQDVYEKTEKTFKKKDIVIGEFGWPSQGYNNQGSVANPENQATVIRRFLIFAKKQHIQYNLMEAFDQPWKGKDEGGVGQYWGIFDAI